MRIGNIAGSLFLFVQFLQVVSWCNNADDVLNNGWNYYNGALYKTFVSVDAQNYNCYGRSVYIIGLRYNGVNWIWNDGTPAIYTNWKIGADFNPNFKCAYMYVDVAWDPIPCSPMTAASICKCAIAVGCNSSNLCSNPYAECTSGICQCRSGYTLSGTNCTAAVGSPCDATNGCSSPYAHCTNGICQCRLGYTQNGTFCKADVNANCDTYYGCSNLFASCNGTCQCKSGYKTSGTLCKAAVGSTCDANNGCSSPYADCTSSTCQCRSGYTQNGTICKADLNSSCNTSIGCSDQYAECKATTSDANNTCQCKNNYSVVGGICKAVEAPPEPSPAPLPEATPVWVAPVVVVTILFALVATLILAFRKIRLLKKLWQNFQIRLSQQDVREIGNGEPGGSMHDDNLLEPIQEMNEAVTYVKIYHPQHDPANQSYYELQRNREVAHQQMIKSSEFRVLTTLESDQATPLENYKLIGGTEMTAIEAEDHETVLKTPWTS